MRRRAAAFCLLAATAACTPTLDPKPTLLPPQTPGPGPAKQIVYPPQVLEAKLGGRVVVECTIETDGSTSGCFLLSVEGDDAFVEPALNFIKDTKFLPATRNGVPVREEHFRYIVKFSPPE